MKLVFFTNKDQHRLRSREAQLSWLVHPHKGSEVPPRMVGLKVEGKRDALIGRVINLHSLDDHCVTNELHT